MGEVKIKTYIVGAKTYTESKPDRGTLKSKRLRPKCFCYEANYKQIVMSSASGIMMILFIRFLVYIGTVQIDKYFLMEFRHVSRM